MKKLLFIFFTAGLIQGFSSCSHKDTPDNALALIPQPQEMKVGTDHFKLTRRAAITLELGTSTIKLPPQQVLKFRLKSTATLNLS